MARRSGFNPTTGSVGLKPDLRAIQVARATPMAALLGVVMAQLAELEKRLLGALAVLPADAHPEQVDRVRTEIGFDLGQTAERLVAAARLGMGEAWRTGGASVATVDVVPAVQPMPIALREAAPSISGFALMSDRHLKEALESFFMDRIADVPAEVGRKIDTILRLTTMGGLPTSEAITQVRALLDSSRRRAMTIVQTEMSRAFSLAAQARAEEAQASGVEWVKTWRRSGKIHSRLNHDIADGQTVPLDKPFKLGSLSMKHPHDPAAPASETINCGCLALYRRADYTPTLPEKKPFSEEEIALNPNKAQLNDGKTVNALLAEWAARAEQGSAPLAGMKSEELALLAGDLKAPLLTLLQREARDYVVDNGIRTENEYGVAIADGKIVAQFTSDSPNRLQIPDFSNQGFGAVEIHHNHPMGDSFSRSDLIALLGRGDISSLFVHGHNGAVYSAERLVDASPELSRTVSDALLEASYKTAEAVDREFMSLASASAGLKFVVMAVILERSGAIAYTFNSASWVALSRKVAGL